MNHKASFYLLGMAGLMGCSASNSPQTLSESPPTEMTASDNAAVTFVSLKVPNMH